MTHTHTCLAAALLLALSPAALAAKLALVGGTLVDGTLAEPIRDSVIIVDGERIVAVGTVASLPVPADAEVVSTEGMTVMPGLWDMHVHLMINGHADYAYWDKKYLPQLREVIMPASAEQLLMAGITSARDLGGPLEDSLAVRDRLMRELPQLLASEFPEVRGRVKLLANGPPVAYPVQFRVYGPDPGLLRERADQVKQAMRASPNTRGVNDNWNESVKAIRLQVDQDKARALGVSTQSIAPAMIARRSCGLALAVATFVSSTGSVRPDSEMIFFSSSKTG